MPLTQRKFDPSSPHRDCENWGDLFGKHAPWLKSALKPLVGTTVADDVVQETFLRAKRYDPATEVDHPRALLWKIARNVVRAEWRAINRGGPTSNADAEVELWSGADQFEALAFKQIVLALPEKYRDVFLLSRIDGMSYDQIAKARGISVKTVEWRMSRALAMCAARIRE